MDKQETLVEKIRLLVFGEEVVAEEFLDVKTSEGVVLRVSELKEGETVTIVSEDGIIPADNLEYVLEDGSKLVLDESGVIVSIEVATEEDAVEDAPAEEEMSENDKAVANRLSEITEALAGVLEKFAEQDLAIEKFAGLPADEEEKDAGKTVVVKHSKESALIALGKFRSGK